MGITRLLLGVLRGLVVDFAFEVVIRVGPLELSALGRVNERPTQQTLFPAIMLFLGVLNQGVHAF